MISFDKVKEKIEKMGYYATEELLYDTYNALQLFENSDVNPGQDIFAICLEGPPGAGKTEFAKTYTKISNEIFKNVELVDYQCDATTGKTELFEDINISAAIRGDADNVNIPGKLIEAIKIVNEGKKVVLFIDEYDKAREETDAFLLQFLQSGKINSTQHGDLEIENKYKGNLQVILCKNDMREELSGPLSRRIRIIRLDYMKPTLFHKVAHRLLIEESKNPVNDGLLNLVSLMYEAAYEDKDMYNRLPSCSEMLIAIEDADRIIKSANAPQSIIYKTIIKNIFKSLDDITTFESSIETKKKNKLSTLIKDMKDSTKELKDATDINSLIAEKVFQDENKKLVDATKKMEELIETYKTKFKKVEEDRKKTIDNEKQRIKLQNGNLISTNNFPNVSSLFGDESKNIKRGYSIFNLSSDWTEVAKVTNPNLNYNITIKKLIENVDDLDIKIYENGILLKADANQKLIAVIDIDENKNLYFKILSNFPVIPATYIYDICSFTEFVDGCYNIQPDDPTKFAYDTDLNIDALIYSENKLPLDVASENVYHFVRSDAVATEIKNYLSDNINSECNNVVKAEETSKKIMQKILERY